MNTLSFATVSITAITQNLVNRFVTGFRNPLSVSDVSGSRAWSFPRGQFAFIATLALLGLCILSVPARKVCAQGASNLTIFGDLKVDESKASGIKPLSFDMILYNQGGMRLNHQQVSNGGRYRFTVGTGIYDIAVEVDAVEIARVRVEMLSPLVDFYQRDIELEWKTTPGSGKQPKPGSISAEDLFKRSSKNEILFNSAEQALDNKDFSRAIELFVQLLATEPSDFQAWTELGTTYLLLNDLEKAEKSYKRAVEVHASYLLALVNLGRVRLMAKNFDGAIETLTRAVEVKPDSAEANFYLGAAYLQIKKGSKAVGYLNEALHLNPIGMAQAHLRLAALYNGAGLKDKAAAEYEEFLKKKPDYPDKQKLEEYITANRKH